MEPRAALNSVPCQLLPQGQVMVALPWLSFAGFPHAKDVKYSFTEKLAWHGLPSSV